MRRLTVLVVVLGILGAIAYAWVMASWTQAGPAARAGGETVVMIPSGTRAHDTAGMLEAAGVVNNALLFEAGLRLRGLAAAIKAGEYAFPSGASMADVAGVLVAGRSIQHRLTVAEGLTSDMVWKLVANDPVLEGDPGTVPEEGTLLPETYLYTRGQTRAGLLAQMRRAQEKVLLAAWNARAEGLPISTMREAVILASIVEKETALPSERRRIAAVFINRLRVGMRLQTDPTIIYGITKGYPLGRGIRQSELEGATPYNTYVIAGLPPGPICNPGKDSIAAVLNPESVDDLFFVADGSGGHAFASSITEHNRNVARWRALERGAPIPIEANDRLEKSPVPVPEAADQKLPAAARKRVK